MGRWAVGHAFENKISCFQATETGAGSARSQEGAEASKGTDDGCAVRRIKREEWREGRHRDVGYAKTETTKRRNENQKDEYGVSSTGMRRVLRRGKGLGSWVCCRHFV